MKKDFTPMCGNCLFFVPERRAPVDGFCRRFPPKVEAIVNHGSVLAASGSEAYSLRTLQPPVAKDYWCGEYRQSRTATDKTT